MENDGQISASGISVGAGTERIRSCKCGVSYNYEEIYPAQLADVKAGIRYLRAHS